MNDEENGRKAERGESNGALLKWGKQKK